MPINFTQLERGAVNIALFIYRSPRYNGNVRYIPRVEENHKFRYGDGYPMYSDRYPMYSFRGEYRKTDDTVKK